MAASCALARPATDARARRTSAAVASSAPSRALHSSCGSPAGSPAGSGTRRSIRHAGPTAAPGETASPARTVPGAGGPAGAGAGGAAAGRAAVAARLHGSVVAVGRRGDLSGRCVRRFAEAFVREPADRRQRLGRLRSLGHDDELVVLPGAQGGDPVQAPRADGSAPVGRVGDGDGGVEPGRGAHQQRGRPGVEAQRVAHRHPGRPGRGARRRRRDPRRREGGIRRPARDPRRPARAVRRLLAVGPGARCSSLPARPPRAAAATASSGSPRPAATAAATAPSTSGASVSRTAARLSSSSRSTASSAERTALPRSMRTSTPSSGPHLLDRAQHLGRVRPERSFRLVQPAGGADAHVRTRHLHGQLGHALREPGAVADDDEADHGYAAPASANAAAAASSSSHDEVAPGSWWPALRSPR